MIQVKQGEKWRARLTQLAVDCPSTVEAASNQKVAPTALLRHHTAALRTRATQGTGACCCHIGTIRNLGATGGGSAGVMERNDGTLVSQIS